VRTLFLMGIIGARGGVVNWWGGGPIKRGGWCEEALPRSALFRND
jgi:hypothetical protein